MDLDSPVPDLRYAASGKTMEKLHVLQKKPAAVAFRCGLSVSDG